MGSAGHRVLTHVFTPAPILTLTPARVQPHFPHGAGCWRYSPVMPAGGTAGTREQHQPAAAAARPSNNPYVVVVGTALLVIAGLGLVTSLINVWPVVDVTATSASPAAARATVRLLFALVTVKATTGTALLLVVMISGGLGSLIQVGTSFGDFVGNRRFYSSWVPWYLMRIVVGMLLALLLYFAFRGGFFSGNSPTSAVNPYGIAALAGLAGLFSKQATDKLREVFETLFRVSATVGDAQRKDDLAHAVPTTTSVDPTSLTAGAAAASLTVHGTHFINGVSVARVNGVNQPTRYIGPEELMLAVSGDLLAQPGLLEVTVFNGPPGGGESKPPIPVAVVGAPVVTAAPVVAEIAVGAGAEVGAPAVAPIADHGAPDADGAR